MKHHACNWSQTKISKNKVSTYIGVELANEAGEIAVLEVTRQNVSRKLVRIPPLSLDCPWWLWLIVMMIIDCFWWLFFIEFWLSWMIVFESYVDCLWLIAFNDYFLIEFFIVFDDCVWELCWLPLMIVFYWVLIILDDCVWELCWLSLIDCFWWLFFYWVFYCLWWLCLRVMLIVFYWVLIIFDDCIWELCWLPLLITFDDCF